MAKTASGLVTTFDTFGNRTVLAADGVTTRAASNYGQQIGFTGRFLDKETGLWFFRARYYSGSLGRFIERDGASNKISAGIYVPMSLMGYQDGFSLYQSYFVPNDLDPSGWACVRTGKSKIEMEKEQASPWLNRLAGVDSVPLSNIYKCKCEKECTELSIAFWLELCPSKWTEWEEVDHLYQLPYDEYKKAGKQGAKAIGELQKTGAQAVGAVSDANLGKPDVNTSGGDALDRAVKGVADALDSGPMDETSYNKLMKDQLDAWTKKCPEKCKKPSSGDPTNPRDPRGGWGHR